MGKSYKKPKVTEHSNGSKSIVHDDKSGKNDQKMLMGSDDNKGKTQEKLQTDVKCISVCMAFITFGVYIKTVHPSLPGGDSGEMIVAANEIGVAHPPGYPVFTLLAKLFILVIPLGSVAWRVNVLSVTCGAICSSLMVLTVHRLTANLSAGVLAAGIFAFSRLTWTWSVSAEVFALNNLLIAALLYSASIFDSSELKDLKTVCLFGAFLCGLCLSNQHTSILFIVIIVPWVLICIWEKNKLDYWLILQCGSCFMLGVLPYIYLPISSLLNVARWTWGDQSNLMGFLKPILRTEYGTLDLLKDHTGQGFFAGIMAYIDHALREMTPFICILLLLSLATTFKRWHQSRPIGFLVVCHLMLLLYLSFFCWRANLDINNPLFYRVVERFWIQSDLLVCIIAAVTYDEILRYFCKFLSIGNFWPGVTIAGLAMAYQVNHWWGVCDHSNNFVIHDFAKQTLNSFPNGSIILTKGDLPSNSLRYFHLCEGIRPDLTVFDQEVLTYDWSLPMTRKFYPNIEFPGDRWLPISGLTNDGARAFTFKDLIDANYNRHPIFACIGVQDHEASWQSSYTLQPFGVCSRLVSSSEPLHIDRLSETTKHLGQDWNHELRKIDDGSWEHVASAEMWRSRTTTAHYLLDLGMRLSPESKDSKIVFLKSFQLYNIEINKHKTIPAYWHRNFGIVCQHLSRQVLEQQSELLALTIYHFTQFIQLEPHDPDRETIIHAIETLQTFLDDLPKH